VCAAARTRGEKPKLVQAVSTLTIIVLYLAPPETEQYLSVRPAPHSNKVILTPKSINPNADDTKEVLELKLQGRNYIRCVDRGLIFVITLFLF